MSPYTRRYLSSSYGRPRFRGCSCVSFSFVSVQGVGTHWSALGVPVEPWEEHRRPKEHLVVSGSFSAQPRPWLSAQHPLRVNGGADAAEEEASDEDAGALLSMMGTHEASEQPLTSPSSPPPLAPLLPTTSSPRRSTAATGRPPSSPSREESSSGCSAARSRLCSPSAWRKSDSAVGEPMPCEYPTPTSQLDAAPPAIRTLTGRTSFSSSPAMYGSRHAMAALDSSTGFWQGL